MSLYFYFVLYLQFSFNPNACAKGENRNQEHSPENKISSDICMDMYSFDKLAHVCHCTLNPLSMLCVSAHTHQLFRNEY